ncbi:hypothetical protein CEXT_232461 [Caerostris extrusa]|uniref:Uncharacterized protein n=1 Tax=Caerostris extrusa TaxID=172846 RepID=A0AAV4X4R6_CAEEX|nr:hypothetical protein CEXT_232461 [Caerostris extrusa]
MPSSLTQKHPISVHPYHPPNYPSPLKANPSNPLILGFESTPTLSLITCLLLLPGPVRAWPSPLPKKVISQLHLYGKNVQPPLPQWCIDLHSNTPSPFSFFEWGITLRNGAGRRCVPLMGSYVRVFAAYLAWGCIRGG